MFVAAVHTIFRCLRSYIKRCYSSRAICTLTKTACVSKELRGGHVCGSCMLEPLCHLLQRVTGVANIA